MRSVITRTALGCLALGVALTLTSCDFPGSKSSDKKPAAAASPSDDNWDQAVDAEINMLNGLKDLDPDLIKDQQTAIDAAGEVCKEIKKSKGNDAGLGQVAATKFAEAKSGLTAAEGDKIVTVLKDTTCK
ncbi:hypothetical protein ACFYS8_21020 [Kitasatospora sp. NPDC004615]|uniref:hypothetical protein n=1 Tax=unclassified Kitasatospora TaxID=2633591 RepID=UPI0036B3BD11